MFNKFQRFTHSFTLLFILSYNKYLVSICHKPDTMAKLVNQSRASLTEFIISPFWFYNPHFIYILSPSLHFLSFQKNRCGHIFVIEDLFLRVYKLYSTNVRGKIHRALIDLMNFKSFLMLPIEIFSEQSFCLGFTVLLCGCDVWPPSLTSNALVFLVILSCV